MSKKLKEDNISVDELKQMLTQLEGSFLSSLDLPEQRLFQGWLFSERKEINRMY